MLHRYTSDGRHGWRECVGSDRHLYVVVGLKPGHSDGASGIVSMSVTVFSQACLGIPWGFVVMIFAEISRGRSASDFYERVGRGC